MNTVLFSNHTGYPNFKGLTLNGEQLAEIFEGLELNNLINYTHLLTGYVKTPTALRNILKIHQSIKLINPGVVYVCDPVLGDNGKLYVSQDLVNIYKEEVIVKADILLPNQTECEYLTGVKISNQEDAFQAIDKLHSFGIPVVIVKSLTFEPGVIVVIGSSKTKDSPARRFTTKVKKLDKYFSGTGDLFAALIVAWTSKGFDIVSACEKTINSLYAVLMRTVDADSKELRLIQSRADLESPLIVYKVEEITI